MHTSAGLNRSMSNPAEHLRLAPARRRSTADRTRRMPVAIEQVGQPDGRRLPLLDVLPPPFGETPRRGHDQRVAAGHEHRGRRISHVGDEEGEEAGPRPLLLVGSGELGHRVDRQARPAERLLEVVGVAVVLRVVGAHVHEDAVPPIREVVSGDPLLAVLRVAARDRISPRTPQPRRAASATRRRPASRPPGRRRGRGRLSVGIAGRHGRVWRSGCGLLALGLGRRSGGRRRLQSAGIRLPRSTTRRCTAPQSTISLQSLTRFSRSDPKPLSMAHVARAAFTLTRNWRGLTRHRERVTPGGGPPAARSATPVTSALCARTDGGARRQDPRTRPE